MKISQLMSIGLFTIAVVLSMYAVRDRMRSYNTEGFENPVVVNTPLIEIPDNPTDDQAVAAHKTLLTYTSQNLENGVRFMNAIGTQFFEPPFAIRTDFDPKTLMNNYISPLQKI